MNLTVKEGHEGFTIIEKCSAPPGYKSFKQLEKSLTTQGTGSSRPALSNAQQTALAAKQKSQAMTMAMKPGQQILMNAFMLYMSGSALNIFSIGVLSSALLSPISNVLNLETQFAQFKNIDLQTPKLIFLAFNLAWLALGIYKMSTMRLLPTTSADWKHRIMWKQMLEQTSVPPDDGILL